MEKDGEILPITPETVIQNILYVYSSNNLFLHYDVACGVHYLTMEKETENDLSFITIC